MAGQEQIGDWKKHFSNSKKAHYWSNGRVSLWHDDSLPRGWAWKRDADSGPKTYVNLVTAEATLEKPLVPAVVEESIAAPPAKRARIEPAEQRKAVPRLPSTLPSVTQKEHFPTRPALPEYYDRYFFTEAHERVLDQVFNAVMRHVEAMEREDRRRGRSETREYALWDVGADYYADSLSELNGVEEAERYKRDGVFCPTVPAPADVSADNLGFAQFCCNFWDDMNVIPCRGEFLTECHGLLALSGQPLLIYIDCDLHSQPILQLLEMIKTRAAGAAVVGGGWNLSPQVQGGLEQFIMRHGLSLHVEQKMAWTFSAALIKATANVAAESLKPATEADVALSAALQVGADAEIAERDAFLGPLLADIQASDDVSVLHSRLGAGDVAKGEKVRELAWLNEGTSSDKFHLNPLMAAAKYGRVHILQALLDEYQVDIDRQAEKSLYTALGLASYEGRTSCVEMLLARGANPTLLNKWGESPLSCAKKRGHAAVAAMLDKALAEWKNDIPSGALPDPTISPASVVLDNGLPVVIREVSPADEPAVIQLYKRLNVGYGKDAATKRVEERWTNRVIATELKGVALNFKNTRCKFLVMETPGADWHRCVGSEPESLLRVGDVTMVGMVGLKPQLSGLKRSEASAWVATTAQMSHLSIHPSLKDSNAAQQLVRRLESWAEEAKYASLSIETLGYLTHLIELHVALGYTAVEETSITYGGDMMSLVKCQASLPRPTT